MYNVVDKLSQNKFIPPFVSSRRHDSDNGQDDTDRFEKNIREFQQSFIALCNDLLREGNIKERRSAKITSLIYEIQKIRDNGYSSNYILSVIDSLKTQVIELGGYDALSSDFLALEQIVKLPKQGADIEDLDFATKQIIRKIESQRTEIDVFWRTMAKDSYRICKEYYSVMNMMISVLTRNSCLFSFRGMKRPFKAFSKNTYPTWHR